MRRLVTAGGFRWRTSQLARATSQNRSVAMLAEATRTPTSPLLHPAYDVIRHESVVEHSAVATLYRHRDSGLELLSVECDEVEKVFGIAFRTPAPTDDGVAHIIEHTVLCGSQRYPDPRCPLRFECQV